MLCLVSNPEPSFPPDIFDDIEQDADIVCQPGVGWMHINELLKKKG